MTGKNMASESTIRARAKREGYIVRKSRSRYISSINHGQYLLMDLCGVPALGCNFDASLNEIAVFLDSYKQTA